MIAGKLQPLSIVAKGAHITADLSGLERGVLRDPSGAALFYNTESVTLRLSSPALAKKNGISSSCHLESVASAKHTLLTNIGALGRFPFLVEFIE
jgi:hypothetical protein